MKSGVPCWQETKLSQNIYMSLFSSAMTSKNLLQGFTCTFQKLYNPAPILLPAEAQWLLGSSVRALCRLNVCPCTLKWLLVIWCEMWIFSKVTGFDSLVLGASAAFHSSAHCICLCYRSILCSFCSIIFIYREYDNKAHECQESPGIGRR